MGSRQDKEQFIEKVFAEMYKELKLLVYRCSYDKELVEDILQETYLAAYRHADELIDNERYRGWMYATAMNKTKKLNYMNRKHNECISFEEQIDIGVEPEYECMRFSAIKTFLPSEDYELLMRHYDEKYTYNELADIYGKTPSYIKMRVSRMVKKLKTKLKTDEI